MSHYTYMYHIIAIDIKMLKRRRSGDKTDALAIYKPKLTIRTKLSYTYANKMLHGDLI